MDRLQAVGSTAPIAYAASAPTLLRWMSKGYASVVTVGAADDRAGASTARKSTITTNTSRARHFPLILRGYLPWMVASCQTDGCQAQLQPCGPPSLPGHSPCYRFKHGAAEQSFVAGTLDQTGARGRGVSADAAAG